MKFICPLIVVEDMQRSRNFYENILGMSVKMDFGENVTFEGDFAIHLRTHYQNLIHKNEIKFFTNNFELYFEHDELESLEQKLKINGLEFVHGVMEQPWRQKVMRVYDPDGHILEFGETMEHLCNRLKNDEAMSIEQINSATGLPLEYIKILIN